MNNYIDFQDAMSKRTDEELIKIVTIDKEDYLPLAIEAAWEEIKNRNIDVSSIEQVKNDLVAEVEEQQQLNKKKVNSSVRFIHYVVDMIVWFILVMVTAFILGIIIGIINSITGKNIGATDDTIWNIIDFLLVFAVFFGYYIFMEATFQKTVGKYITRTKVVTKNNTKPTTKDIIIRTFCRFIPFDNLSFLVTRNGFHDRFSDTMVIKDNDK